MTLNELVYDIKNLCYAGLGNDDSIISDKQIAHWINVERMALIQAYFEKRRLFDPSLIQDLGCLEVSCIDKAECCNICINTEEHVYRTLLPIPTPISTPAYSMSNPALLSYVGLITYSDPFEFTSPSISAWSKYNKYTKHIIRAYYRNGYIYLDNVKNPYELEFIAVRGVFQDPFEAGKYSNCDNCKTYDDPYPIPGYLVSDLKEVILKKYVPYIQQQVQDVRNDSKTLFAPNQD
jgi:hypothetical protein